MKNETLLKLVQAKTPGERLRILREAHEMTLPELAAKAKLPKSNLSKLENDKNSNPSLSTLRAICKAFNIRLSTFVEWIFQE